MKKLTALVLVALLVLSLAGCAGKEVDLVGLSEELAANSGSLFTETLEPQNEQSLKSYVKLDTDLIENYEFYAAAGYTGEEYGLFACNSANDAKTLVSQLQTRVSDLQTTYESYAPEAVARLDNALIQQSGAYVVYVVANDQAAARDIVEKYI